MEFLEIMLYVLGSILLVVLIVLGIKLIISIDKVNLILDDVQKKLKTVDNVFNVVDKVADSCALLSDRVVEFLSSFVSKMFIKRKIKKEKLEEEEM